MITEFVTEDLERVECPNFCEIRESKETGFRALHALRKFSSGELLADFSARVQLEFPNYLTVQIGKETHIILSPEYLQYINHGCSPNVFFDTSTMQLKCIQSIEVGDELKFFYPSTEWSMNAPFKCHCGADNCLGQIQGAAFLDKKILLQYDLNSFIKDKLGSL